MRDFIVGDTLHHAPDFGPVPCGAAIGNAHLQAIGVQTRRCPVCFPSIATCPECGADRSEPIAWGTDIVSIVLRDHYPDARECKACGASWSPKQIEDRKKVSEMLANLPKAYKTTGFTQLVERETAGALEQQHKDDEWMAAAARGEPFWGRKP